jgi:copper transport protein
MSRIVRLGGLVAVVLCLTPTVAWAHAGFVSASPEPGSELSTAPGVVTLNFSEPLNARLSRAAVTTPDGVRVEGKVTSSDEITAELSTNAQGIYDVSWTTVSVIDGHTLTGSFRFGVGVPVGPGGEGSTSSSPRLADLLIAVARTVEDSALLVSVGLLLIGWLGRRDPPLADLRASPLIALAVASVGGLVVVLGEAFAAAGRISAPDMGSYLTTGLPGIARLARPLLELVAVGIAWRRSGWVILPLAAALVALAAAGHAAAASPPWAGISDEAVHLASAGVWAGGILALAFQKPLQGWRSASGRALLERFTPVALFSFAATATTGAIRGWQEVGSFQELLGSSYGAALLVKVLLVVVMVQLSVLAWRRVLVAPRWESIVAVGVIAVAALLAAYPLPPARLAEAERTVEAANSAASALPRPGDLTLGGHAGEFLVGLTVRTNPNEVLVFVKGLDSDQETALRTVSVSVDGRPLDVMQCGATCRRAPARFRGGEHVQVIVAGTGGGEASFAIPELSAPYGDGLLDRMMTRMHELQTYRLDESLTSGGPVARASYAFQAPDRLTIDATSSAGHSEVVWIGDTRYLRKDDGPWTAQPSPATTVPSFIWDTFRPFTASRVIGHDRVHGLSMDVVAFFGGNEGLPIWFRLWIDPTGLVHKAEMRAQGHFMDHRYFDFDTPISITPPT